MSGKRLFAVLLGVAVLVAAIAALSPERLTRTLTRHDTLMASDAIVLLAGSMKERVPAAAMLYRDGYAPRVLLTNDGIFSSWSTHYDRNLYNVEWAEEELVKLGVPRHAITKLPFLGKGTVFEALAIKREVLKSGIRKLILTTSDYHTYRAHWIFQRLLRHLFVEVRVFPARSFNVSYRGLLLEVVKIFYYQIRFGLLEIVPD